MAKKFAKGARKSKHHENLTGLCIAASTNFKASLVGETLRSCWPRMDLRGSEWQLCSLLPVLTFFYVSFYDLPWLSLLTDNEHKNPVKTKIDHSVCKINYVNGLLLSNVEMNEFILSYAKPIIHLGIAVEKIA